MKGNAFWVGKGASGYSITSVVDGDGMPHGRKWQSDNLRPGDIGISLRLDTKNQPEMSADQKKVLAEQVKLFSEQALQFLGQEPVQSFFVAPGDFVVPESNEPDWLGKVVKVDQLGVTLHKLAEHDQEGNYFQEFEKEMTQAPLVFIPWNNFQVRKLGRSFTEVFLLQYEARQIDLFKIYNRDHFEIVEYLRTELPDFSISNLQPEEFEKWFAIMVDAEGMSDELLKIPGFKSGLIVNADSVWKEALHFDKRPLAELFMKDGLSTGYSINLLKSKGEVLLMFHLAGLDDEKKSALAKKILDNLARKIEKDSLLFSQDLIAATSNRTLYCALEVQISGWINMLCQDVESLVTRGLANQCSAEYNLYIQQNFDRDSEKLAKIINQYRANLHKFLDSFLPFLWKALIYEFLKVSHPLVVKMVEFKFSN